MTPGTALISLLRAERPTVFVVEHPAQALEQQLEKIIWDFAMQHVPRAWEDLVSTGCRCVSIDRLAVILKAGTDSESLDGVIWADLMSKALEYGGETKILLAYNAEQLRPSCVEVPANTDPDELARLGETFRTREVSVDGSTVRFSRLPANDRRFAYEAAHGRWFPGNPMDALSALVVLGSVGVNLSDRVRVELERAGWIEEVMRWPDPDGTAS